MTITEYPLIYQAFILFISQVAFIYFRTLNVYYNSKLDRFGVMWTGAIIHIVWLLTIAIGISAIVKGNYWLVAFSLTGGLLGADRALINRQKIK